MKVAPSPAQRTTDPNVMRANSKFNGSQYTEPWTVDPSLAMLWLEKNRDNRVITTGTVNAYAEAMKRGEWKLTHQGIAFSSEGILLDGQHRLWAIIEANVTVPMNVTFNADPETFRVLDQGKRRSMSDLMHVRQTDLEPINRLARFHRQRQVSSFELQQYVDKFLPASQTLNLTAPSKRRFISTAVVRGACILRIVAFPDHAEYVYSMYTTMVARDYPNFTPIMTALTRHLELARQYSPDSVMMRVFRCFDPKRAENAKLHIKELDDAREEMNTYIAKVLTS